jgi:CBS-domain-containing membrane protein
VVDEHNRVRGIVTRKDLLGYKLDEALQRHYVAPATRRATRSSQHGNGH